MSFESIMMYTLDGTDYIEFTDGEIIIHRLEHDDAIISAPEPQEKITHWLLEK